MRCPGCGAQGEEGAKFCQECGGQLRLVCGGCGTPLPPTARFCRECGAEQAAGPAASGDAPPGPRSPTSESYAGGRYEVVRPLGEGARKRVYLARDTELGRDVALSIIKSEGLDEPGRGRVRHEARSMARLGDHPHVVTVHDIGEQDEQLYIVSEYMAGGDVERQLQRSEGGRLPVDEVLRIGCEVCDALEHAHQRGIVHRDLKPGNVWLKEDGSCALGDFGLALSEERTRITGEGMMVGTVAYMAPEQALGRTTDSRSDLYALGVTLYEMLTGRTPFAGDDAVSIISQHIHTPPVAPSWHNPALVKPLDELVLRLLAKDPDTRPKSALEVRDALRSIAGASGDPTPASVANPLDALASGVFVGRESEVEKLRATADAALSGNGRIALLVGEPGIGKTRTAEELGTYASMRGGRVLWGRGYEGQGAPTYWPWVQIVRGYVQQRDPKALREEMGPGAAAIAEVVAEIRQRLPDLETPVPLGPEEARFRLFDSLTAFFRNAARARPLVLVLDDLHWADKPSLALLQFLARELAGTRLLLLGTYRDVELSRKHPLVETLGELSRSHGVERVLLRGLSGLDVARFIELTTGRPCPPPLAEAVFRETEGNPFFVHEVVRLLASEGRLEQPRQGTALGLEIPQGVREAVGRRLNKLSDECNELLAVASVMGRQFDRIMLGQAAGASDDRVIELLDEALAARLLQVLPETPERYRFSHALVRETLYGELGTTRRVRLHRSIGEAIEELRADRIEERLSQLAHHFGEGAHAGGDVGKAIDYSIRAGRRAVNLLAHEHAIPHFERALQLLDLAGGESDATRCDLLLALGQAQHTAGDASKAVAVVEQAAQLARQLGDARRLAAAAAEFAQAKISQVVGEPDPSTVALCEEALAACGDEPWPERISTVLGLVDHLALGEAWDRALELARQGADVARRIGDHSGLVRILATISRLRLGGPDLGPRVDALEEARWVAAQHCTADDQLFVALERLHLFFQMGDYDACRQEQAAMQPLLERTQDVRRGYFARVIDAMWASVEGRLEEAERLAQEAFAYGQPVWGELAVQIFGVQLSTLRFFQGRLDELVQVLETGAAQHPQPVWKTAAAWANAALGDLSSARRWFEKVAPDDFAVVPRDATWLTALSLLAEACAALGDRERAGKLYAWLLPYAEHNVYAGLSAVSRGPAHRFLGLLARTLGDPARAQAHFERAEATVRRLGMTPYVALVCLDRARLLTELDREGDREDALRLLNESLDAAKRVGMPRLVEDALALKLAAQGIDPSETRRSIYAVARSLQDRAPDLGGLSAADGSVTLVFSDMEGFTRMTERLGDAGAHRVMQSHHAIVREQTKAHGGNEVELRGDGFLLAFADPFQALRCCVGLQRAFASYSREHPDQPLRVRVGLHTGQAIRDADKFFGKTVIQAFRVADLARGGEILVSEETRDLVAGAGEFLFDPGREAALKGMSGRHRLFSLEWTKM